jgi:membrane protein implicated in regulation of membrane protease activity
MNKSILFAPVAAAALLLSAPSASAAGSKTYQVTGPVIELTNKVITVQKGDDKWEIARTPDTKVSGELKVGSKVTIVYTMTASKVEVK